MKGVISMEKGNLRSTLKCWIGIGGISEISWFLIDRYGNIDVDCVFIFIVIFPSFVY